MTNRADSRRKFLRTLGAGAGTLMLFSENSLAQAAFATLQNKTSPLPNESDSADFTLHIQTSPVEIAPNRIISATTYNGRFPGPLLRFKEGQQVTIDIYNETDVPEQLHWHGQKVPTDVDGAAEEGTPYIPAHGTAKNLIHARPGRLPLLSHSQPGWRESCRRAIQRPSGAGVHRTETRSGQIRSRSVSRPEGVRADVQPRRRHGSGFSVSRDTR